LTNKFSQKASGDLNEKHRESAQATAFQGIGRNSCFSFDSVIA
jgi:hypothetical protein